ncbi:uncharacterized protein PAC_06576 [Phialocephala subalpina]|uniref:Heterokaryon incompatibility domain-containing protein n=1 Tax=Phialocephala subalpina TaxID=576137 RepID=A0A1L7WV99_9HELO|nr:uncharacterized protein PAC_06576 [Phialocephala subalpina]
MASEEIDVSSPAIGGEHEHLSAEDLDEREGSSRYTRVRRGGLKNRWEYKIDNNFPLGLSNFYDQWEKLRQQPVAENLCYNCECLRILSKFVQPGSCDTGQSIECKSSELARTAEPCELCKMFGRGFRRYHTWVKKELGDDMVEKYREVVDIFKEGSTLIMGFCDIPVLTVYAESGISGLKEPDEYLQRGLPELPDAGITAHFELLREWLRVCDTDKEHKEYGCYSDPTSVLPTRVLDLGDEHNPDSLRLYCSKKDEGDYIALSHCWGSFTPGEVEDYRTLRHNFDARTESIDINKLPRTFQDAIQVARELEDWEREAKTMEVVYSMAYWTLAATSASKFTDGFLGPRPRRTYLKVANGLKSPIYVCDFIDDFHRDVEDSVLNKRDWVLQERALSR